MQSETERDRVGRVGRERQSGQREQSETVELISRCTQYDLDGDGCSEVAE